MVIRFYMDYPNEPTAIPTFLTSNCASQCVSTSSYNSAEIGAGISPDYSSSVLISSLETFISALAAKYDGDNRIAFIQIGLLGFWGEWHTYSQDALFNDTHNLIRQRVIRAFGTQFTKTFLLVSQDSLQYNPLPNTTSYNNIGWHDDDFGSSTCNGQDYSFQARVAALGVSERWKTVPMGGEVQPTVQNSIFATDTPANAATACSASLKFSWLLYYDLYNAVGASSWYARALPFYRTQMGYQFVLSSLRFNYVACSPASGTNVCGVVELDVKNVGNAPFYYPIKIKAAIGPNKVAAYSTADLRSLLPSATATTYSVPFQVSKTQAGIVDGQSFNIFVSLNSSFVLSPIRWAVTGGNTNDGSISVSVPATAQCVSAPVAIPAPVASIPSPVASGPIRGASPVSQSSPSSSSTPSSATQAPSSASTAKAPTTSGAQMLSTTSYASVLIFLAILIL
jgi:hypothetical protein